MKIKKFFTAAMISVLALAALTGCSALQPLDGPGMVNEATTNVPGTDTNTDTTYVEDDIKVDDTNTSDEADIDWSTGDFSTEEKVDRTGLAVNVTALKGPTAMGLVNLMDAAEKGSIDTVNYNFKIVASPDEVGPALLTGETDIATMPANMASVLFKKSEGKLTVLAINTLGVIYIMENGDSVKSVADLKGKTIYASGKGATPEYSLRYILFQNGINPDSDVTIEWKSEHAECLAAVSAKDGAIAMLPEPFVTNAMAKVPTLRVALDLTEEWNNLGVSSSLITGVAVARKDFAATYPDVIESFLSQYGKSVSKVSTDLDGTAKLVGKYDIVAEDIAKQALPRCNIVCITGEEMKQKLGGYIQCLLDQNAESVGGCLPDNSFYYGTN